MKRYICFYLLGLLFSLTGCYEDKGNYSYTEINEMTLSFSPSTTNSNQNLYSLPRPTEDTLYYELTAVVEQTREAEESNVEYMWMFLKENTENGEVYDTVYSKTYTFKFPPQEDIIYDVLVAARDKHIGVERYRRLKLKTIVPFLRSMMILHGPEGDRKIAALEYDSTGMSLKQRVDDICYEIRKEKDYRDAIAFSYVSEAGRNTDITERLYLLTPDNCFWIHPFTFKERADKEQMMPLDWQGRFKSCMSAVPMSVGGILDEEGNFYHGATFGFYYQAKYKEGITGARVDRIYMTNGNWCYATLWDNTNKRLMYYKFIPWLYDYSNNVRQSESAFDQQTIGLFPAKATEGLDLPNEKLLWLGYGVVNTISNATSAIFRNEESGKYHLLNIGYEDNAGADSPEFVKTDLQELVNADFEDDSKFAVSSIYTNQIFYSLGSEVYLYNTITEYTNFLASVGRGNKVTRLAFRLTKRTSIAKDDDCVRILGIGVETASGQGEYHELLLDESGDVVQHEVYGGFGPVVDFCYTFLMHQMYDI